MFSPFSLPRIDIDLRPAITTDQVPIGELRTYLNTLLSGIPDDAVATLGSNNAEALARGLLALEGWARGFRKKTDESQ